MTGVWVALLVLVLAVEAYALGTRTKGDTLTEQVWRLREISWLRIPLWAFWAWLTYHFWIEAR